MANTWQGEFPWRNQLLDGYEQTSPVGSLSTQRVRPLDMAGNVWEWTSDWYSADPSAGRLKPCLADRCVAVRRSKSYDPSQPQVRLPRKVIKGGSYLCAPNYCLRFRPAARSPQTIDTSMSHLGFRCVMHLVGERQQN